MKTVRLGIFVFFALLVAGCSLKPTWDLVGKWQKVEGTETIEFFRNGTLTLQSGNTALTSPFRLKDPKHLQVDLGSLGICVVKVSVSKDKLTLTDPSGKASQFQKAK